MRDKLIKYLLFVPKSSKKIIPEIVFYIDNKAMPIVRKLLQTIGNWERQDVKEFYQINAEICQLTNFLNYAARDEEIQALINPNLSFLT